MFYTLFTFNIVKKNFFITFYFGKRDVDGKIEGCEWSVGRCFPTMMKCEKGEM